MSFNFRWMGLARQSGNSCNCGCVTPTFTNNCGSQCKDGKAPHQFQVTISGFSPTNAQGAGCCAQYNGTFLLDPLGTCEWLHSTNFSGCPILSIQVTLTAVGGFAKHTFMGVIVDFPSGNQVLGASTDLGLDPIDCTTISQTYTVTGDHNCSISGDNLTISVSAIA